LADAAADGGSIVSSEHQPLTTEGGTEHIGARSERGLDPPDGNAHVPASMRLQILSTEHWSLLASRSLAWNESFSRAGMFLATLSGAIVALALVAQATDFGEGFVLTALVILPVVLFVGVATVVRLSASNYHDALCVIGMNRIRHAYLEMAPELERYFVMASHDDLRGVGITMGMPPGSRSILHVLAATPSVIGVVNSVIVAVILGLLGVQAGVGTLATLAIGIVGFVVAMVTFARYGAAQVRRGQQSLHPVFPSPAMDDPGPSMR